MVPEGEVLVKSMSDVVFGALVVGAVIHTIPCV